MSEDHNSSIEKEPKTDIPHLAESLTNLKEWEKVAHGYEAFGAAVDEYIKIHGSIDYDTYMLIGIEKTALEAIPGYCYLYARHGETESRNNQPRTFR